MKPIEVILSSDYVNPSLAEANRGPGMQLEQYSVAPGAVPNSIRIGGRIL
jgi:hypothetical protein